MQMKSTDCDHKICIGVEWFIVANYVDLYSNVYDETYNGFTLQHLVNDYICDNQIFRR